MFCAKFDSDRELSYWSMPFSSVFPFPHIDIEKLFCFTGNAVEADNCQNSVDPWEVMKQVDVEKRLKGVEAI